MRTIKVPGRPALELAHLLLDVNGTLAAHGDLIDDVATKLRRLQQVLDVHLLSADTFGSLAGVSSTLGIDAQLVHDGAEKVDYMRRLGSQHCAAIGNGANDKAMLSEAALGIAVIGPEGAAAPTIAVADVVCRSIGDALGLLLDDRALAATLRP
ncbi:MAG: HAD hydrolase family protein [Gaiellaceae bacterium]